MASLALNPYANRYPGAGEIVFLCEGDVAGYEVDLLEKWLAGKSKRRVDVQPCGTKESLFGMSDAIGRAVPLVVIEDRDFRTPEQARGDCEDSSRNRTDRDVRVKAWVAWQRNEIENYVIEPEVLLPKLAAAFSIKEEEAETRLATVIESSRIDQAAQWTLACFFGDVLKAARRVFGGLPRKKARPNWDSTTKTVSVPNVTSVRDALAKLINEKWARVSDHVTKAAPDKYVAAFDSKYKEWESVSLGNPTWRIEWAGKDILLLILRSLAGEFGWPLSSDAPRLPIDWTTMTTKKSGELERLIANTLQPMLVSSFLSSLEKGSDKTILAEWTSLVELADRP